MAQLKDLLVNGVSRLIGDVFIQKINAPTATGGTTFGPGTSGQVLKTNGSTIYWDNDGVNSATEHYTPSTDSGSALTKSASGGTAAWSVDVVKGITISRDAKGHVTDLSVTSGKTAANPLPVLNVTHSAAAVVANNIATWNAAATASQAAVLKDSGKAFVTTAPSSSGTDAQIPTSKAVWSAISGASGYGKEGTVTSVRVQATSPLASSVNTAQSSTLDTTISFSNVDANKVLAGPTSGNANAPSFRQLGLLTDINYTIEDQYLNFEQVTTDGTLHTQIFALSDVQSGNFNTALLDKCLFKLFCFYGISYHSNSPNSDPLLIILKSSDQSTTYFSGALSVKELQNGTFAVYNVGDFNIDIADYFVCNKNNTKINLYNASEMSAGAVNSLVYTKNPFTHAGILNYSNIKIQQEAVSNNDYLYFAPNYNGNYYQHLISTNDSLNNNGISLAALNNGVGNKQDFYLGVDNGGTISSALQGKALNIDNFGSIQISISEGGCGTIGYTIPANSLRDTSLEFGDVFYIDSDGSEWKNYTTARFGCFVFNPGCVSMVIRLMDSIANSQYPTSGNCFSLYGLAIVKIGNYNINVGQFVYPDNAGKAQPLTTTSGSSGNYANAILGQILLASGVITVRKTSGTVDSYTLGKNNYALIKLR